MSTRLYPNVAIAPLVGTDEGVSERLMSVLLRVSSPSPSPALQSVSGFGLPQDYREVEALMRELRMPPFDHGPVVGFAEIWRDHRLVMIELVVAALTATILLGVSFRTTRRLRRARGELRHKADQLEEQGARLRLLLDSIPDKVWFKDPEDTYVLCNPGFAALSQQGEAGIIGRNDGEFFEPVMAGPHAERDRHALQADHPITTEEWLIAKGKGAAGLFQTTRTAVRDGAGEVVGVLGISRDITALRDAEMALAKRVSEQLCLYAVFRTTEDVTLDREAVFAAVLPLLPAGWSVPSALAARIEWDGHSFASPGWPAEPSASQEVPLAIDGTLRGWLVVAYRSPQPIRFDGPFLREERELLIAVGNRLREAVQRIGGARRLRESEQRFRGLFSDTRQPMLLQTETRFVDANRAALEMLGFDSLSELVDRSPAELSPEYQPDGRRSDERVAEITRAAQEHGAIQFEWEHIRRNGEHFFVEVLLTPIKVDGQPQIHVTWRDVTDRRRAAQLGAMSFEVGEAGSGEAAVEAVRQAAIEMRPFDIVLLGWRMPDHEGLETVRRIRALGLESSPRLAIVTACGRDELRQRALSLGIENILLKPVAPSTLFDTAIQLLGGQAAVPLAAVAEETDATRRPLASIAGARVLLVEDNALNREVGTELLAEAGLVVDVAENGEQALVRLRENSYDAVLMDMQMPAMDGGHPGHPHDARAGRLARDRHDRQCHGL